MDVYKLKFTILQLEIFKLFCVKSGQQISQRQISKYLGVSPTAIAKSLPLLEKEGIITITKGVTNVNFVALNTTSKKVRTWKQSENIHHLHNSGIVEYLEQEYPEATISIQGSYALGTDIAGSEIEIVITRSKNQEARSKKHTDVTQYEKKLEKTIKIIYEQKVSGTTTRLIVGGTI